ncbi:MAG: ferritin-like domain-containing protein [Phycisphaerales bacterium]
MATSNRDDNVRLDSLMLIESDTAAPDYRPLVEILNDLYAAESRSVFRYLQTWNPYTTAKTIKLRRLGRELMQASFDHSDRLARLIERFGGVPIEGAYDKDNADANYADWTTLLVRLIESKRAIIARYRRAIERLETVPSDNDARTVLIDLNRENTEHLEALELWRQKVGAGPTSTVSGEDRDAY